MTLTLGLSLGITKQLRGNGGGAPVTALRPVLGRTKQTWATAGGSDGVNTVGRYLIRHQVLPGGIHGPIEAKYCNRRSEANGFNSITVSSSWMNPQGTGLWIDAAFSASPSVTITASGADVAIDPLDIGTADEGDYVWELATVSVASVGQKWPTLERISLGAANGEGSILSTSPIVTIPTPLDTTEFYGAVAVRALSTAPIAFMTVTDSIGNGNFDTPTLDLLGFLQKKFGPTVPFLAVGTGGETMSGWLTAHSKRLALGVWAGCNVAVVAIGTNDVSGAVYSDLRSRGSAIFAVLASMGLAVVACPILTKTVGNISTPDTGYTVGGIVDQYNTYLQYLATGGGGLLSGFIDTRPGWQNASNQILSATYTDDFLHPNAVGHPAIAVGIVGDIPTVIPAAPIPPTFWTTSATYLRAESLKALYADGAPVTSWADIDNTMAAVEVTNPPVLDYDAANGKAAVLFASASNQRLVAPAGGPSDNIFATDGLVLIAFRAATTGGGGFARLYEKGGDRIGFGTATQITPIIDFSVTDSSQNITTSFNVWHVVVERYRNGVYVPAAALDSFTFTNSSAPSGTPVSNAASPLYIANAATNNRALDGAIAGFAWFKAAALSEDQIAAAQAYFRADTGVTIF